jgi:hypothetical protein
VTKNASDGQSGGHVVERHPGSIVTKNASDDDVNDDVKAYKDFHKQWESGTLTGAHPVMTLVDYWARVVAFRYGCAPQYTDLKGEALLSLATESNYEGRGSLKAYVLRVLISKVSELKAPLVRVPRKPKKDESSGDQERVAHKYVSLDDHEDGRPVMELPDERSDNLADKVLRKIAFDKELRERIAALPELHRVIVDIVIEHEEILGSRRIAEEASKRLGRKITRYRVEVASAQLAVVVGASLWLT